MLRFIIGTNEEARRKLLYEDIAKEKSSYLIVPEQFSFESEKLLDEFLGTEKARCKFVQRIRRRIGVCQPRGRTELLDD